MKETKSLFNGKQCMVCGNTDTLKVKKYRHNGKVPTNTTRCTHCKAKEKVNAETLEILKQVLPTKVNT